MCLGDSKKCLGDNKVFHKENVLSIYFIQDRKTAKVQVQVSSSISS
jgi:hypothetical protein